MQASSSRAGPDVGPGGVVEESEPAGEISDEDPQLYTTVPGGLDERGEHLVGLLWVHGRDNLKTSTVTHQHLGSPSSLFGDGVVHLVSELRH